VLGTKHALSNGQHRVDLVQHLLVPAEVLEDTSVEVMRGESVGVLDPKHALPSV
jgi:hypothetical protein